MLLTPAGLLAQVRLAGLPPGVASNLIGLACIAAAQERSEDTLVLLEETSTIAELGNAQRILRSVSEARAELPDLRSQRPG